MFLKKITLAFALLLLTACGYHLRGDIELPPGLENIYIEAASGMLQQEMQEALKSSQVKVANSATEAGLIIKFSNEEMTSRIISLNTSGRANQFQLIYQLMFSIYEPSGNLLLGDQNVNIKREYFNDQTAVLGKSNEESVIRTEMYKQAVSSIMSRLSLAMASKAKKP
jgi:LPS-assembly lipoprotein